MVKKLKESGWFWEAVGALVTVIALTASGVYAWAINLSRDDSQDARITTVEDRTGKILELEIEIANKLGVTLPRGFLAPTPSVRH